MKRIIYRSKETGKISHDGDYDEYLRRCKTEQALVDNLTKFNEVNPTCFAEIVEIDDVAEFYAKRAEQRFNIPDDIAERLHNIAGYIADIASEIEAMK